MVRLSYWLRGSWLDCSIAIHAFALLRVQVFEDVPVVIRKGGLNKSDLSLFRNCRCAYYLIDEPRAILLFRIIFENEALFSRDRAFGQATYINLAGGVFSDDLIKDPSIFF